ncbi:ribokinase [Flammeovirga kamogawensis]|uniref:Ribokinase n=1 Tax=Flammeovirga kamogawensis TaxID=373891 RepID=A0ABX8H357_9BACT|nr:ribokinase [Flammeovirga kamogawensis]MBB6463112.1 ribokinase [Flammeovirga kamogawensis]QWG10348.1 ribokinase [Flammeovirga kamogawensis]TRX63857.1 ribokinase [Flammeovirga kamogawensis]
MNKNITVVGSSNTDMVVKTTRLPQPGETILGGTFNQYQGGKGANQAVAAAKLNGNVTFIAKVGKDSLGVEAIKSYQEVGINTNQILKAENEATGVALITVDDNAENSIVVSSGANALLSVEDITQQEKIFTTSAITLVQLETPIVTVQKVVELAKNHNNTVVLNPAPAQQLSDAILKNVDIITPNETETQLLTGVEINDITSMEKASEIFHNKGINTVVITLGKQGAYLSNSEYNEIIPAPIVKAIDTTAAGDVFNGALTVALVEGENIKQAIQFASKAASIAVTRNGAQNSAPTLDELL